MTEIYPARGNVLTSPFLVANRGRQYFSNFMKASVGVFLAPDTPEQHVVRMLREQPLHEAGLGVSAMHRGEKLGQSDLIVMGRLMVAGSVLKADESKVVPDRVTAEVVDIALEEEIYPAVNQYLPVLALDRTKQVLEKYDPTRNVIPLFPNRDN